MEAPLASKLRASSSAIRLKGTSFLRISRVWLRNF